jgi:hypothetical protein
VPLIEVENRGADPLLLPAHVVLAGGWQTRSVERSVIVGGGGSARVPVKCVEAGRWAPRDDRSAASFEITDHTSVRARWSTSRSMAEQLHRTGHFAAEQSVVWQHVDEELSRSPVGSRTRSYEAYLRAVRQPFVAEAKKARIAPAPLANAVAILPRGGGFWIEAYPTPEALAARADDLLADLFDPASASKSGDDDTSLLPELDALLESLWAMPLRPLQHIEGTLGDTFAFAGDTAFSAAGAALLTGGALAHLSVGAPPSPPRAASVGGARGAERSGLEVRGAALGGGDAMGSGLRSSASSERGPRPGPAVGAGTGNDSGSLERPRVDLDTMRGIYARARDLLPEGPLARERVHGYRLVRVLDRNISWVDVRLGGDGYAVLGSHDRCDLVLSSDSGVWLRHLAAICVRLDDDSIGLRLIDLKTDLPFFLDDDTPRWSVLATGPFAMRLGRHVVCGFPIGAAIGDEPSSSPAAAPVPRGAPEAGAAPRAVDPLATNVVETGITRSPSDLRGGLVVPAPGAGEITSFVPSAPVSQIQDLLGPSTSSSQVRVTLERGGMGASVELPLEALDAGVLLGRALNCFDGGLRRIFCEAISRAHVLLLRDHGEVSAYDLCSTNGTRVGGQRIRRFRLADAGSTLELGKKVVFRWRR